VVAVFLVFKVTSLVAPLVDLKKKKMVSLMLIYLLEIC
jgi:hypothetical protein